MKRLQRARSYNESEVFLEHEMKTFWEITRGMSSLELASFLGFWLEPRRANTLRQSIFSDDWISILYQRVRYLLSNKTLLGTEEDKIHQAKTILATGSLLRQEEAAEGAIAKLASLYNISDEKESIEPEMLKDDYPIFFQGFVATESKAAIEAHILCSGFNLDDTDEAMDLIVISNGGAVQDEVCSVQLCNVITFMLNCSILLLSASHLPKYDATRVCRFLQIHEKHATKISPSGEIHGQDTLRVELWQYDPCGTQYETSQLYSCH